MIQPDYSEFLVEQKITITHIKETGALEEELKEYITNLIGIEPGVEYPSSSFADETNEIFERYVNIKKNVSKFWFQKINLVMSELNLTWFHKESKVIIFRSN